MKPDNGVALLTDGSEYNQLNIFKGDFLEGQTKISLSPISTKFIENWLHHPTPSIIDKRYKLISNELRGPRRRVNKRFFPRSPHLVCSRTIIILTEICWNTVGDFYAAYRLITALKKTAFHIEILWFVMARAADLPQDIPAVDFMRVVESWEELAIALATETDLFLKFYMSAVILQFPQCYFFPSKLLSSINSMRDENHGYSVFEVEEYDYAEESANIRTGLSEGALGVFLDCKVWESTGENGQEVLDSIDAEDATLRVLLGLNTIVEYRSSHELFFSYYNKQQMLSYCGRFADYVKIVLAYCAEHRRGKNIDIIAPYRVEKDLLTDVPALRDNCYVAAVEIIDKDSSQVIWLNESGIKFRIINHFRFSNEKFVQWMAASHPFKHVTGDQSFSDLLSIRGALPFYQVMFWKAGVMIAFKKLVTAQFGESSFLLQFINYCSKRGDYCDYLNLEKIVSSLNNPTLYAEMDTIRAWLFQSKNLYSTLPAYLLELVDKEMNEAETEQENLKRDYPSTRIPLLIATHITRLFSMQGCDTNARVLSQAQEPGFGRKFDSFF